MDTNIAAWMIAGGPRIELQATHRDRAQLHAFRESQRVQPRHQSNGLIARIRQLVGSEPSGSERTCCPA
ncbi:MAG: hypothetical protein NVS9B8_02550 [Candidatus Limnocylindrales bacterium]